MAYRRSDFKNKVESPLTGAIVEFYKARLARKNGQTRWVEPWLSEVRRLVGTDLVAELLHPIRGFTDRRKGALPGGIAMHDRSESSAVARALRRLGVGAGLLIALPGAAAGCVDLETAVTVRDPARVAVLTADGKGLASGAMGEVALAQGVFATGTNTEADYKLSAVRRVDSSTHLRWDTRLPIQNGERLRVLSPAGVMTLDEVHLADVGSPDFAGGLRAPLCATLSDTATDEGDVASFASALQGTCAGARIGVPFVVSTPRDNLLRVHERRRVNSMLVVLGSTVVVTGFVPFATTAAEGAAMGNSGMETVGVVGMVSAAALEALGLLLTFAASGETVWDAGAGGPAGR